MLSERWGVPLAAALGRNPEVVSHWISEARVRRKENAEFALRIDELDRQLQTRFPSRSDL